jgi:NAD+ kinase
MKIAVMPNNAKEGALCLAEAILKEFPCNCFLVQDCEDYGNFDIALVLGGDGTILRAVKAFGNIPVLGINFGTVGYMASAEKEGAIEAVKKVLCGEYKVEERMMLSVSVLREGKVISESTALNDGVITRCERILSISESFNEKLVYSFSGDGIIVATPTGSTAYSLSAGGPVVVPSIDCILVNSVCAHTVTSRPMVISDESKVKVTVDRYHFEDVILSLDGARGFKLRDKDVINIKKSENHVKLIRFENRSFYDILRTKLSERN